MKSNCLWLFNNFIWNDLLLLIFFAFAYFSSEPYPSAGARLFALFFLFLTKFNDSSAVNYSIWIPLITQRNLFNRNFVSFFLFLFHSSIPIASLVCPSCYMKFSKWKGRLGKSLIIPNNMHVSCDFKHLQFKHFRRRFI